MEVRRLSPRERAEAVKASVAPDQSDKLDQPEREVDLAGLGLYMVTYASQGLAVKAYLVLPERDAAEDGKGTVRRDDGTDGGNRGIDGGTATGAQDGNGTERAREWPGLVYCRGGIRRVGMVNVPRMAALARRGYAVMAPVYRGNLGGEGKEDFAGEDRHDAIHAVKALAAMPQIRRQPIPLVGFSRGAVMALAAAAEGDAGIGPVAVWGGVSDMFLTYRERVDLRRMLRRVVGHPQKDSAAYERRSPVCWVEQIHRPVLILHGTADRQVGVLHARLLAEKLEACGKPYAMCLYDGLGHRFPDTEEEDAIGQIVDWFARHGSPPAEDGYIINRNMVEG